MRIAGYRQKDRKKKRGVEFKKIYAIKRSVLETIMGVSKSSYPDEFAGVLRTTKGDGVIDELVLLPGTMQGRVSAIFHEEMLPVRFLGSAKTRSARFATATVGSVHSHPSGSCEPSYADLRLFDRFGKVHIISCYPFSMHSWRAYNPRGEVIHLDIVED